jgi:hypothetical protein
MESQQLFHKDSFERTKTNLSGTEASSGIAELERPEEVRCLFKRRTPFYKQISTFNS